MKVELTQTEMQLVIIAMQLALTGLDSKFGQALQDAQKEVDSSHKEGNVDK